MLGFMPAQVSFGVTPRLSLCIALLACSCFSFAQQQKKEEGNAVERTAKRAANATERTATRATKATERGVNRAVDGTKHTAKKVDKALTHAGEKTENWVKEKTR